MPYICKCKTITNKFNPLTKSRDMAKKNIITAEEWMAKYNKSAEECIDHLVERNAKSAKNKRFYNKSSENKEKFYDMCVKGIVSMFGEDYREYAIKSLDKFFEDAAANKAAIRKEAAKKAAATRAYRKGMTAEQVEADKAESKMSYLDYLAKCAETTAEVAEVAEVETPTTTPTTEYVDELNPNGMQPLFTPKRIEHLKVTLPAELGVSNEEIDAALEILTIPHPLQNI